MNAVEEELNSGKTGLSMKDIGSIMVPTGSADLFTQMAMSTSEDGCIIRPQARVFLISFRYLLFKLWSDLLR